MLSLRELHRTGTDGAVFGFVFVVVIEMQTSEFLLRTILRRLMGKHFSFYLDALSEIDQ